MHTYSRQLFSFEGICLASSSRLHRFEIVRLDWWVPYSRSIVIMRLNLLQATKSVVIALNGDVKSLDIISMEFAI